MIQETPELDKLRLEACHTGDKTEFGYCYREYRRKGGLRKLVFVPKRKIKKTYAKVFRMNRNGEKSYTNYANQLSNEFVKDCMELRASGMRFDDIAESIAKNHGYASETSVKYACSLRRSSGLKAHCKPPAPL